jgi:TolB-like protein
MVDRGTSVGGSAFELDVRSRELRGGGTSVRLQAQPFEILRALLERPGDVVTRDELRLRLWPDGTVVDFEHRLNAAIRRLRTALGNAADRPLSVETVPRSGYRLIAPAPDPLASRVRLGVLPFSDFCGDNRQKVFNDGLIEELIAQLGVLCKDVEVVASRSSNLYKDTRQRARDIGESLQAGYLLEGGARCEGVRVRITAALVDAAAEVRVWSECYERVVEDTFSVQTDIASRVARAISKELNHQRW